MCHDVLKSPGADDSKNIQITFDALLQLAHAVTPKCLEVLHRRRPGLALKPTEGDFAVEQKIDANIALVLEKVFLAPAGKGQTEYFHRLSVGRRNVLHDDLSTLSLHLKPVLHR